MELIDKLLAATASASTNVEGNDKFSLCSKKQTNKKTTTTTLITKKAKSSTTFAGTREFQEFRRATSGSGGDLSPGWPASILAASLAAASLSAASHPVFANDADVPRRRL